MSDGVERAIVDGVHPLDAVGRARVVARLHEAADLVGATDGGSLERARGLLEAARDHLDAWMLGREAGSGGGEGAEAGERGRICVLMATDGQPPSEFRLLTFGDVRVERPLSGGGFVFTESHAAQAVEWFERVGRKLAIDYEHQSFERFNTRADGLSPAAGWIGSLEVREDGLWACDVTWTERARELLTRGEYRYFSPVIYWADEDSATLAALGPVALTNDPAIHGSPSLAARRCALESEATEESQADAAALSEEVELLRRKLAAQEADTFVERGMRAGKIVEATSMDWRAEYLRDAEGAVARLSRSLVVLPPGRILRRDEDVRGGAIAEAPRVRAWDVDEEDLASFERATASGRVSGAR